jgi:hypothetical protein
VPLLEQSFTIDRMKVKSDLPISLQEFNKRFLSDLYGKVSILPTLPTAEEVDYIKVESGNVSLVMK